MKKSEEAARYIAEKQKEIGLGLLILMRETNAETCKYETELLGEGKKYKVTTKIIEITSQKGED